MGAHCIFTLCFIAMRASEKTAYATDGQLERKVRNNKTIYAQERTDPIKLPPNRMILASYQVGDSPLWLGTQAVHHAAADETPVWG